MSEYRPGVTSPHTTVVHLPYPRTTLVPSPTRVRVHPTRSSSIPTTPRRTHQRDTPPGTPPHRCVPTRFLLHRVHHFFLRHLHPSLPRSFLSALSSGAPIFFFHLRDSAFSSCGYTHVLQVFPRFLAFRQSRSYLLVLKLTQGTLVSFPLQKLCFLLLPFLHIALFIFAFSTVLSTVQIAGTTDLA